MTTVISVVNQKGGVGKTTSVVNLGDILARMGLTVLIIDTDTQGNCADLLGLPAGNELIRMLHPDQQQPLDQCIIDTGRERLQIIRSDKTTAQLKSALAGNGLAAFVLAEALASCKHDVVLIDCAPSLDLTIHLAVLIASHWILIPAHLQQLAIKGVREAFQSIVTAGRHSAVQVTGILPTFLDNTEKESKIQLINLVKAFGEKVYPPIPVDAKAKEAPRFGKTLNEYAPGCRSLFGYKNGGGRQVGGYLQVAARLVKDLDL
ncbi:MAG TPA: ParA family protein [Anaerolineales bacterium]|nr:ParA family protein [Anaerolineales bacterium]